MTCGRSTRRSSRSSTRTTRGPGPTRQTRRATRWASGDPGCTWVRASTSTPILVGSTFGCRTPTTTCRGSPTTRRDRPASGTAGDHAARYDDLADRRVEPSSPGAVHHQLRRRRFDPHHKLAEPDARSSTHPGRHEGNPDGGPEENPTRDVVFSHCQFDGGIPPWFFRTDRKAVYHFFDGEKVVLNNLGENTSDRLLQGNPNNTALEIHHCEFLNAHDVFLQGQGVDFHHNWINNLQDDGLAVGFDDGTDGPITVTKIHENVITRTLTGFSFSSRNHSTQWYIYRNLIDQRPPIRGVRPRRDGDTEVWRYGQLHKTTGATFGPHDLFQNTVLAYDQKERASFLHYASTTGPHRRRSFNNVFVAVNPEAEADRAITFVPSPAFPGPTDGNLYHRIGFATNDPFRHVGYQFEGQEFPGNGTFANLEELHDSLLFQQSRTQYPPGYEANSVLADPKFRRIGGDGRFRETNDLRLGDASPALAAGIGLPDELGDLDPLQPDSANPDIGCYQDAEPLRVGVDGCRSFPRDAGPSATGSTRPAAGVWRSVFLHEFPDGDPANLHAVPGALSVLPDGLVVKPTPEPADRGFLAAPGRSLGYRFAEPFDDVIGVDLSIDLLVPLQPGLGRFFVPLISLGDDAVELSMRFGPAQLILRVDESNMRIEPSLPLGQTTRFRVRWHTHGQIHLWHEGVLRAYQPGFAAGRTLAIDQLVVGGLPATPILPRFRARRIYLKLLRRDDARRELDRHVSLDVSCQPASECAEHVRVLQEELVSRTRVFMAGIVSKLTTSWREGEDPGPFSAEAVAAHDAAVGAAEAFGAFLDTCEQGAADTFLQRIGEFFDILAAADPAGYAELLSDLAARAETVDQVCRRTLEPVHAANAETLQPLVQVLQEMGQRMQNAGSGAANG